MRGAGSMSGSQKDHCGHWGAFVSYLRESLNKNEGSGVGVQVVLVIESAPDPICTMIVILALE